MESAWRFEWRSFKTWLSRLVITRLQLWITERAVEKDFGSAARCRYTRWLTATHRLRKVLEGPAGQFGAREHLRRECRELNERLAVLPPDEAARRLAVPSSAWLARQAGPRRGRDAELSWKP